MRHSFFFPCLKCFQNDDKTSYFLRVELFTLSSESILFFVPFGRPKKEFFCFHKRISKKIIFTFFFLHNYHASFQRKNNFCLFSPETFVACFCFFEHQKLLQVSLSLSTCFFFSWMEFLFFCVVNEPNKHTIGRLVVLKNISFFLILDFGQNQNLHFLFFVTFKNVFHHELFFVT